MSNPYDKGSFGERWDVGWKATKPRMDKARIKIDHLQYAIDLLMDTDTEEFSAFPPYFALSLPSEVSSAEGGHRIIAVDLDDQRFMWDLAKFRQLSRNTSWYAELGHMPTKLLIFIDDSQDSVHIYDRTDMSQWIVFTTGSGYCLASSTPSSLRFLDGILYVADSAGSISLLLSDFTSDNISVFQTSGKYKFKGVIADRNSNKGFLSISASPTIVNNIVNAVAVIRDPEGSIEADTGRPKHIVAVATAGGMSVSDAGINSFFDSTLIDPMQYVSLDPSGMMFIIINNPPATRDQIAWKYSVQSISVDSWNNDELFENLASGSEDIPNTTDQLPTMVKAIPGASVVDGVSPVVVAATPEFLMISHAKRDDNTNGLTFIINAVANWPPYSSTVVDVWALENANGLFGKNFTNNNSVSFASDGVIGKCATFDGVNQYLKITGDADLAPAAAAFSFGFWYKSDSAVNEANTILTFHGGINDMIYCQERSVDGGMSVVFTDDNAANTDAVFCDQDIQDMTWHHIVVQKNTTDSLWELWIDGVRVATTAIANCADSLDDIDDLYLGSYTGPADYFDGSLDQLMYIKGRILSAAEIRFLYQRGLSAMQSSVNANDALDSAVITAIDVSPNGEYIAVVVNGAQVVILDRYGIPILEDAGTTIDDVAVWRDDRTDDPSYAIANAASIEVVQSNPRVLDRA